MMFYSPEEKVFSTIGHAGFVAVDDATKAAISASVTGGGVVWLEDGAIRTSGPAPSPHHVWRNGAWEIDAARMQAQLQEAKSMRLHQAAEAAQAFIDRAAGIDAVPQFERDSWATQALEAQAWAANPEAPTPILAGIAKARGVPPDVLRQKALAKSQAFAMLTAVVAGQRQAIEDKISAADNMQALDAVVIAYQIPGAS